MEDLRSVVLVAVGGVAGALARFGIEELLAGDLRAGDLPWGTLVVNLLGAFAIGLVMPWVSGHRNLHPLVVVGVLGGFTTVSAFAGETVQLLEAGRTLPAVAYIAATLAGGLVAVAVGAGTARRVRP